MRGSSSLSIHTGADENHDETWQEVQCRHCTTHSTADANQGHCNIRAIAQGQ